MIILVEGPDGAGKSTLIENLMKSIPGCKYTHFGAPANEEEMRNYWQVYADAIKAASSSNMIFDRCWLSDLAYGPVMRPQHNDYVPTLARHARMLEAMVVTHGGGYVIYCTAPTKVLWARCQRRGETYITNIEMLDDIATKYSILMKECSLPVIRYDTAAKW